MPLATEPLPEINDNQPAAPVAPETPAFSLDAIVNDNIKAPDFKIVEDKVIRSDTKLPEDTTNDEVDEEENNNDPQNKQQQDKKAENESKETKKTVADKDSAKDSKEDDKSGEDKPAESDEEVKEDGEAKSAAEEAELKLHGNTTRDYSGFNDKQIKLLKRLDTGRFNAISGEWRALQSAAMKSVELVQQLEEQKKIAAGKGIPQSWYEHPEAYTLTPEFRQMSNQYAQYADVETHYKEQLASIQDGKPWTAITGVDAQGNFIYSAEQQPSPAAFSNVNVALMQAMQAKGQIQGKIENMSQQFTGAHKQAAAQIDNEIKTYLDKLHPEVKPVDKDVEMITNLLPPMFKSHPLAKGFSQLVAMNFAQARFLKKLLTEKEQGAKLEADKKLAGPRGGNNIPPKGPSATAPKNGKDGVLRLDYLLQDD